MREDAEAFGEMQVNRSMNCLTVDVEEHFQVTAFDSPMRRRHWDQFESRVERNTYRLLELLADRNTCATFFILGWIAERHPGLVRTIAESGHEVASHGYAHEMIAAQTPAAFREDVRETKSIIEDVIGEQILGYRAPSFSISSETQWALPILVEEGYVYDSSIFPILHDRYGWNGASPRVHQLHTEAGMIWEIPPSTVRLVGRRIPMGGGGYLRLYPYWLLRRWMKKLVAGDQPLVMYIHPWELDPDQPRMSGPLLSRFRHYVNLNKTQERLINILQEFSFMSIREAIKPVNQLGEALRKIAAQGGDKSYTGTTSSKTARLSLVSPGALEHGTQRSAKRPADPGQEG